LRLGTFPTSLDDNNDDISHQLQEDKVSNAALGNMFRSCILLKSITLEGFSKLNMKNLEILGKYCSQLTELFLFHIPMREEDLIKVVAENFAQLVRFEVAMSGDGEWRAIESKIMIKPVWTKLESFIWLYNKSYNLQWLPDELFECCSSLTMFKMQKSTDFRFETLSKISQTLRTLRIEGVMYCSTDHLIALASKFPNLTDLNVEYNSIFTTMALVALNTNCKHLRKLNIYQTSVRFLYSVENFCDWSRLVELTLPSDNYHDVKSLQQIFESCEKLRYLDISHSMFYIQLFNDNAMTSVTFTTATPCNHGLLSKRIV